MGISRIELLPPPRGASAVGSRESSINSATIDRKTRAMLTVNPTSLSIPPGTVCLTFDDGPGRHTLDIARHLARHRICATFFVVGHRAERSPEVVREVRKLGHWVGNHTYHHRPLAALAWAGNDVVEEVVATDRVIADLIGDGPALLRPPYGNWSAGVAAALNRFDIAARYVGPVLWDIDGADYRIGGEHRGVPWTLEKCQAAYLTAIDARQRGVVLLHDGCPAANATLKLVQWLVPRLKGSYEFNALNEVVHELPALV